jgi:hypothetical protein
MVPLSLIVFIFCGHSNMNGHCSLQDTVKVPHVWIYRKGTFALADDRDYAGDNNESGSPVLPFLKRMAILYPEYNFCGIKMASSCAQAWHRHAGDSHTKHLLKQIAELKERGATFGGVVMNYGFIEGTDSAAAEKVDSSMNALLALIRSATENRDLPCIVSKYEINCNNALLWDTYHKWNETLIKRICGMEKKFHNVIVAPIRDIPKEHYCDSHHWTADGYRIFTDDATALYQMYGYDFWYKGAR